MTELEKRIDFVKGGIKALRAGWRDLRRLMNDVAKAYPEDSEIRAKFLSDITVIGKFVRGVRPATLRPTLDEFRASLTSAEASLAEGLLLLKIFEIESHAALAQCGDVDSASEPNSIRTAPDQRITDQWDEENREILERVLPAEPCVLCERVAADRVMWDDDYSVGFNHEDPISTGHAVIIPRRHERDFFALPEPAQHEIWDIVRKVRAGVAEDYAPDGWTVVIDSGHDVAHAQLHLIPRYAIRKAPDQRITDQWDEENREILARVLRAKPCVLCERVAADRLQWDGVYWVGFNHEDPVSTGHAVIMPQCHERDFFALSQSAQDEIWTIAKAVRAGVAEDYAPDGWTVVIDSGHDVDHAQVHLIPRYAGDIPSSRGEPRRFSSDPTTGRDAV